MRIPAGTLWRIEAPHYVAGLIVDRDRIVFAAPILGWTIGKDWRWVRDYLKRKGFHGQNLGEKIE